MYYIKNGLGKHWQFLAVLYSLFGALTVFGTGNATQVNTIVAAIDTALLQYNLVGSEVLSTLNLVVGIAVAMLVAMVLLGGIKRIGSVSERLVPFMALFYIVLAVGVVALNLPRFPAVMESIFAGAFNRRLSPAVRSAVSLSVCRRAFPGASSPTRRALAPVRSPTPVPTRKSRSSRACLVSSKCLPIPSLSVRLQRWSYCAAARQSATARLPGLS